MILRIRGDCSARELIDAAKTVFGVRSAYAVARECGLEARLVQRYYQKNRMPHSARASIFNAMNND